jgi:hypothetical protein
VWKTADPRCGDDLPLGELLPVGPPRKPDGTVIIPMVLQFDNTMDLQRVELEEEVSPWHFWVLGS